MPKYDSWQAMAVAGEVRKRANHLRIPDAQVRRKLSLMGKAIKLANDSWNGTDNYETYMSRAVYVLLTDPDFQKLS